MVRMFTSALLNGALSFAISLTVVLTAADAEESYDRTEVALTAGISGFLSGVCASYFGADAARLRRKSLYRPP